MNTDKFYAEQIANEYSVKETTKVKQLKKLDAKAKNTANVFAYTFGVASSLVLGTGMCLSMSVIGSGIGAFVGGISEVTVGISLGFAGGAMLYIVSGELIPESRDMYKGRFSVLAYIVGFIAGIFVTSL